jgi:tetratricopeptide (TPR) repeat protein
MRTLFLISALVLAAPTSAAAQVTGQQSASVVAEPAQPRLDTLFADLKRAGNERAAQRIAGSIWREWSRSGSASIDLLMQWAQEAMRENKNAVAMDFLDQVVLLAPDYAEGWNRRATLHFTMGSYSKSMADIERALQLEPRHFGALGGMASILRNSGRKEMAVQAYERLLDVYPMMRSAQTELGKLADELAGEGI